MTKSESFVFANDTVPHREKKDMCSSVIANVIDQLESGAYPQPIFFGFEDCTGGQFPNDPTLLPLSMYDTTIPANTICPNTYPIIPKAVCTLPIIMSAVLPPNLRITFTANTNGGAPGTPIREFGQTNVYSNTFSSTAHIPKMGPGTPLVWYSQECKGEKNGCNTNTTPDNCNTPTTQAFYKDDSKNPNNNTLLKSMVSCNSPLWPSFIGIDTNTYINPNPDPNWRVCELITGRPNVPSYSNRGQDYCVQGGFGTVEALAYKTVWTNPPDDNCGAQPGFFQACSCVANEAQALASNASKTYGDVLGVPYGDCGPNYCGKCVILSDLIVQYELPCICSEVDHHIDGSTESIQISLVNNANQVVTFEELQVEWCTNGLTVAGITIDRYTNGTPACDLRMREACSNTASLTIDANLNSRCACIVEEKKLQAQFAGVDLPAQCFSTVCNISNTEAYKTKSQLIECSARLCVQTLSINGSNLLAQGFQQVICNGQVYDVSVLPSPGTVPLVSTVQEPYGAFVLGPLFYVAIALLVMVVLLVIVWTVQRFRTSKMNKEATFRDLEAKYIKDHR